MFSHFKTIKKGNNSQPGEIASWQ